MKKWASSLLLISVIISSALAGAFLDTFTAKSEGENIKLEWRTGEEQNVKQFIIERRTPQSNFNYIAAVPAKGSNSYYIYTDESAYKTHDVVFIYRLKIVDNDEKSSHSNEITVSHYISGVKRTWGSIKAMFR